jgi:uncharacterized protein (DUF362 family)
MAISVALTHCVDYSSPDLEIALDQVLAALGGLDSWVKPGQRVLLKPNLLTGNRPGRECVTRPELVRAIARRIYDLGATPFLGDSPAFGSARGVALNSGYGPLLDELGLEVVEFQAQRVAVENPEFQHLRLSKEALAADVVINLPKVKSHVQLTMSLGVKNLFGCVPGKMKAWWHMEAGKDADRFGRMLVETARAIAPDLTLADGIIAHEGNGPSGGEPRPLGVLAGSRDVFALDLALLQLLGLDPQQVPTTRASQQLGLLPAAETITFPLQRPEDWSVTDWQLPDQLMPIDFGAPRVLRSTFKHLYIRWIKEPLQTYTRP